MVQTLEQKRAYAAKWRDKNRDKVRAYMKDYYWASVENKEKSNAATKSWYDRNKKKVIERTNLYWKTHIKERESYPTSTVEYALYMSAKSRAKKEGLPFNIELEDIVIPTHCPILRIEFSKKRGPIKLMNPSLDKIVPKLGYVKGNIDVISLKANMLKNDMSLATARRLVAYIEKHTTN